MPTFSSYDGTRLAYHVDGSADADIVCLPGGPGRASTYLGDLGGLSHHRKLIKLDGRGTGASPSPDDPATYRCDRLVEDVDALRGHLGHARMTLFAHSAAADLALLYAARHPGRLARLLLVTPSTVAAGFELTDAEWRAGLERLSGHPWYADAHNAIMAWNAGDDSAGTRRRAAPLFYGRWDETVAAHAALEFEDRAPAAAEGYYGEGAFDPASTRARLAELDVPVLVVAGGVDWAPTPERAAELANLFPDATLTTLAGSAHYPWITEPEAFVRAVADFLA